MLAIFNNAVLDPPQELHSPASLSSSRKAKDPEDIFKEFLSLNPSKTLAVNFSDEAGLAYVPSENPYSSSRRIFCGLDNIYCIFLGGLNNLSKLNKQYGLSKGDEAMFVIEAYRTLRDRGPYPAHQVLRDLEGTFGFVIYDSKARSVFAAQIAHSIDIPEAKCNEENGKPNRSVLASRSIQIHENVPIIHSASVSIKSKAIIHR